MFALGTQLLVLTLQSLRSSWASYCSVSLWDLNYHCHWSWECPPPFKGRISYLCNFTRKETEVQDRTASKIAQQVRARACMCVFEPQVGEYLRRGSMVILKIFRHLNFNLTCLCALSRPCTMHPCSEFSPGCQLFQGSNGGLSCIRTCPIRSLLHRPL